MVASSAVAKKRVPAEPAPIPPGPPTWASSPEAVPDLAAAFRPGATIVVADCGRLVADVHHAGDLRTSTKHVVALDPLTTPDERAQKTAAPPGTYPVFVSVLRDPTTGARRVAAAALVLSGAPVSRWKALRPHVVDSGVLAFSDSSAATALGEFGAEYDEVERAFDQAPADVLHVVVPLGVRAKKNVVLVRVGFPDTCVGYQALAADGTPTALVVGLGALEGDRGELEPTPAADLLAGWLVDLLHHVRPNTRHSSLGWRLELTIETASGVETVTGPKAALAALARHAIGYLEKQAPISSRTADVAEVPFAWRTTPGEVAGTLRVEGDGRRLRRVHVKVHHPLPLTRVPDVVGQWWQKAAAALDDAHLVFARRVDEPNRAEADTVLRQSPAPGADVPCGADVTLDISSGPSSGDGFTLPTLDGLTLAQAEGRLTLLGLTRGEVLAVPATGAKPGTVLSSTPPGGAQVERGAKIDLTVAPS